MIKESKILGMEYVPLCKLCGQILWGWDIVYGKGLCGDCVYDNQQKKAKVEEVNQQVMIRSPRPSGGNGKERKQFCRVRAIHGSWE